MDPMFRARLTKGGPGFLLEFNLIYSQSAANAVYMKGCCRIGLQQRLEGEKGGRDS